MAASATFLVGMRALRQHLLGGGAVMTPGIAALGSEAVTRLIQTIATFDDFCNGNDPYGEDDFGAFDFDGIPVMFKIDISIRI